MQRPFYRSLLFYLGFPGLLFLQCAWLVSCLHSAYLTKTWSSGAGSTDLSINHSYCQIYITIEKHTGGGLFPRPLQLESGASAFRDFKWFPQPIFQTHRETPGIGRLAGAGIVTRIIALPHWLIILLYLALWLPAFVLRRRRTKRHLTSPSAAADPV